jgi:hypothetical protein
LRVLLRAPALRAELFLRAGPRVAAVLVEAFLEAPVLRAPALRVPLLRVLVRLLVRLLVALRAPVLRPVDLRPLDALVDDLRATVLRVPLDAEFDPRFAPVREPAVRLELLRDDFLVAMLYSGTVLDQPT